MALHTLQTASLALALAGSLASCGGAPTRPADDDAWSTLAEEVRAETLRTWQDYKRYAWGKDVLLPLSKQGHNWYPESLGISPFDAYSTLKLMGFDAEAAEIEAYALAMDWDKDVYVQVFEVNIRILGGLLAMFSSSGNPEILAKAADMGNRLLPAFDTPTGIPTHSVNLRTGQRAGDQGQGTGEVVNVAQAASYLFEFGVLSYYTEDPKYYAAAKRATMAVASRRSELGLVGETIDSTTGDWQSTWSHLQACIDSYYEYMLKSWLLFGDPEIGALWQESLAAIQSHLLERYQGNDYYTIVHKDSGEILKRSVSLYDPYIVGMLALAGETAAARRNQDSWHAIWTEYGLLPTRFSYDTGTAEYPNNELNPELIESAFYLHRLTGDPLYRERAKAYWEALKEHCRSEVGFHSIEDVRTMEPKDYMPTFFLAETLKYFYLTFAGDRKLPLEGVLFSTEAHQFPRSDFDPQQAPRRLGF